MRRDPEAALIVTFFQQVVNGLATGGTYAVVAVGFGLIFSVMRVINFAHPDLAMTGAYVAYLCTSVFSAGSHQLSIAVTVVAVVAVLGAGAAVAAAGGMLIERLVIRPTRGRHVLITFIATAGVAIFLENGATVLFGPYPVSVGAVLPSTVLNVGGVLFNASQLLTVTLAILLTAIVWAYVQKTRWGLATRAVAELADVAAACGVNVNAVSRLTLGIASAMAGAAGVAIALSQASANPLMGQILGLKSFVCMLVAGNRYIAGILAVGFGLGVLEGFVAAYVSSQLRDAVAFTLLLVILMFRPQGLFGSYDKFQ